MQILSPKNVTFLFFHSHINITSWEQSLHFREKLGKLETGVTCWFFYESLQINMCLNVSKYHQNFAKVENNMSFLEKSRKHLIFKNQVMFCKKIYFWLLRLGIAGIIDSPSVVPTSSLGGWPHLYIYDSVFSFLAPIGSLNTRIHFYTMWMAHVSILGLLNIYAIERPLLWIFTQSQYVQCSH